MHQMPLAAYLGSSPVSNLIVSLTLSQRLLCSRHSLLYEATLRLQKVDALLITTQQI